MPRRRLRKRQQPGGFRKSASKIASDVLASVSAKEGYQALMGTYKAAKAIKAAARSGRKMKKQDPASWSNNQSNGIKYRNVSITYKKQKLAKTMSKLGQLGSIYQYSATGGSSSQGVQAAAVAAIVDGPAIASLYTALNNAVPTGTFDTSHKLYYKGSTQTLQFSNSGPTTCEFDIYICIDKQTTGGTANPLTYWNAVIPGESGDGIAPVEASSQIWTRPTYYKGFNIAFWTKRLQCNLTPGEKCELTVNVNPHRVLDTQYMSQFGSIRGITYSIMTVQRGTLGDGTQTLTVTAGEQSISPSKLLWLNKRRLWGSIVADRPRVNKMLGSQLPTTIGALWQIDEDTGEPENAQLAAEYA